MKPRSLKAGPVLLAIMTIGIVFTLISWSHKQSAGRYQQQQNFSDTPQKGKKTEKKIRNLDEALDELDAIDLQKEMEKAHLEMEKAMKELDGAKIKMEIDKAMKDVDFEKMQREFKESMAKMDIDMAKMKKELAASMKDFDSEKVKQDIEKAMKEVDFENIKKECDEAMAKVDWEKIEKEMDEVKKIDMSKVDEEMAKAKKEMEKIGPQLEKEMQKAKIEIEKAKVEMKEYKGFVDGLDNDGLIKKNEAYSIEHKNGELLINGKKASNATYQKYRSFLEKHPKFKIEKSDDDFNIDVD